MLKNGFGFVIIGGGLPDGRVGLTTLQNVMDVQFREELDTPDEIHQWGDQWGGNPVARYARMRNTYSRVRVEATTDGQVTHSVAESCYAQAWTRLLDLWVPPDFTDATRSQILTHFTFNDMQQTPPPVRTNIDMSGFHLIGKLAP